ncbi:unnamed protein product, partial [Didymodactylos carnosus]
AEQLGCNGKIDEAQAVLEECEQLRAEREMKTTEVCNVCDSFLIVCDVQCRIEEHINGKQHVGYARIRSTLEELHQKRLQSLEKDHSNRSITAVSSAASITEREHVCHGSSEERHKRKHYSTPDEKTNHHHLLTSSTKRHKVSSSSPSYHHNSKKHHHSSESKEEQYV